MAAAPGAVRIGTSGWIYGHWRGLFYPAGLPQARWFQYYASQFDTVEINGTFYRLPSQAATAGWREAAPEGFVFAWKASQYITHSKKLKDPEAPLERVYAPMLGMGAKLGPCLFQLPPQMKPNIERLEAFLAVLPTGRRHTVEFRDPAWYSDAVFEALRRRNIALCISDHHHAPAPWLATADFVYVRGHGPGGLYYGSYSDSELEGWARPMGGWLKDGLDVFAYFDNDIGCAAPFDALRLKALVG